MIKINNKEIHLNHFPDGTLLIKEKALPYFNFGLPLFSGDSAYLTWQYENNEELVALIFIVNHLRSHGHTDIHLNMPYIPNARQDRVKNDEDVFTLKYFSDVINWLNFKTVTVLDPHSSVSEALIDRIKVKTPKKHIDNVIKSIGYGEGNDPLMLFYPDEGAMKRYSSMHAFPYAFGIKKRNWENGTIIGLDVSGMVDMISGSRVLIIDDICSKGGTFYHSAKKLKELGATEVYLFVSHCENTILEGDLLKSGLVDKVFTTNSIFTEEHEKIEVMNYDAY